MINRILNSMRLNWDRETMKSFWWLVILIFGPFSMMWDSCSFRPIVHKKSELIKVNYPGVNAMSNKEIEEAYQYGVDNDWF